MNEFRTWLDAVGLGAPKRITGDVVIQFRGEGPARFRVQHARDAGGMPDDLSWCDVSAISNRNISDPTTLIDAEKNVRGFLVSQVNGNQDACYRRHTAGWIRVLPMDDENREECDRCQAYIISIQPVTA